MLSSSSSTMIRCRTSFSATCTSVIQALSGRSPARIISPMLRLIAVVDSVIGVAAICLVFAVAKVFDTTGQLTTIASIALGIVAAIGIAALIASYGLAGLHEYGVSYH